MPSLLSENAGLGLNILALPLPNGAFGRDRGRRSSAGLPGCGRPPPDIGAPDGNTYPLMSALGLEKSRTKVYGWVAGSFNFSTSAKNNFPVSYDIFPNKVELNQAVVYIERLPDTVRTLISTGDTT
jgi:hypothetical protein